MAVTKAYITFRKRDIPFKGYISTWQTHRQFDKQNFKKILAEFKKIPILLNIQYIKIKYRSCNQISVSFSNEADEAAFILLTSNGADGVQIDVDDDWFDWW